MAYTVWSDTNDFAWLYVAPVSGDDEPVAVLGDPDGGIRDPDWQPAVI
jgi:hypothetical protein